MAPQEDSPPATTAPADPGLGVLVDNAEHAATLLKALGHDGRLTILCHLLERPHSVTQLEELLDSRQAAVSQQLARLRLEGLVQARREGHQIFYSLSDDRVGQVLRLLRTFYPDTPLGTAGGA